MVYVEYGSEEKPDSLVIITPQVFVAVQRAGQRVTTMNGKDLIMLARCDMGTGEIAHTSSPQTTFMLNNHTGGFPSCVYCRRVCLRP
jgi:hypothetical protein